MEMSEIWTKVMEIAQIAVEYSNGRIVMVFNEHDESKEINPEAAHFLKLDGKRFGQDIETYGFLADEMGWDKTLVTFLGEIIIPLKEAGLLKSYQNAARKLQRLGHDVFPKELLYKWNDFFRKYA